jgi:hypothetical protein
MGKLLACFIFIITLSQCWAQAWGQDIYMRFPRHGARKCIYFNYDRVHQTFPDVPLCSIGLDHDSLNSAIRFRYWFEYNVMLLMFERRAELVLFDRPGKATGIDHYPIDITDELCRRLGRQKANISYVVHQKRMYVPGSFAEYDIIHMCR